MMLSLLLLVAGAESPWTTVDQAGVANVAGVTVSPDGRWAAAATTTLELFAVEKTGGSADEQPGDQSGGAVSGFCNATGAACAQAAFSANGTSLAFVSNSSLYVSHLLRAGTWSSPLALNTGGDAPLAFVWAPHGGEIAYSAAVMLPHSATEPRVLVDDVIIDVIMGKPSVSRNRLCFAGVPAA